MQHDWNKYFDTDSEYWNKVQKIYNENEEYPKVVVSGRNLHHKFLRSFSKSEKEPIDNDSENLVSLDLADHYLVHYYLWKCTRNGWKRQTAMAFRLMNRTAQKYITDEIVELLAKEYKNAKKDSTFSDEHRKHLSEALKGRMVSDETRKKQSKNNKGKNNPRYGKHLSESSKRKLSEAKKGKPRPKHVIDTLVEIHSKKVMCIETGEVFDSGAEAARSLGLNRCAVNTSIRLGNTCGGFHWKHVGEENNDQ